MKITSKKFPSPKGEITWYELTNAQGASVVLSTMGAGMQTFLQSTDPGIQMQTFLQSTDPGIKLLKNRLLARFQI